MAKISRQKATPADSPAALFQRAADAINLKQALKRGAEPNDLLPPRPEDNVGGEVGNRFIEALLRDIKRASYDPAQGYFVQVPKSSSATRPAALLTLADRVVYEALVDALGPRIESTLLGTEIVFWPRGTRADKAWREFEASPLISGTSYVTVADISAFYESIDHEMLTERLIRSTGRRFEAEALLELLDRVMNSSRGLPQGLPSSDHLATSFVSQVDYAMIRDGYHYTRHGDDIRIASETYDDARKAVLALEARIREAGLQLNAPKTKILKRVTYESQQNSIDETIAETRRQLVDSKARELAENSGALESALEEAEKQELGWEFFYHGRLSLHEVIDELRPHLEPDDTEIAEKMFEATIEAPPGSIDGLSEDAYHQRLALSLVRLAAADSEVPLRYMSALLQSYPDKTELFCSYLAALSTKVPAETAAQLSKVVANGMFHTEWEAAWITRTLGKVHQHASLAALGVLRQILATPYGSWLFAIEAAKVLAFRNELPRESLSWLWNTCPRALRTDLVVAAEAMSHQHNWAKAFLQASQDDSIHVVVARQLAAKKLSSKEAEA
jgi:hypothetical protein